METSFSNSITPDISFVVISFYGKLGFTFSISVDYYQKIQYFMFFFFFNIYFQATAADFLHPDWSSLLLFLIERKFLYSHSFSFKLLCYFLEKPDVPFPCRKAGA